MDEEQVNRNRASIGLGPVQYWVGPDGHQMQVEECDLESPHPAHCWEYDGTLIRCPGIMARRAQIDAMGRAVFAALGIECEP